MNFLFCLSGGELRLVNEGDSNSSLHALSAMGTGSINIYVDQSSTLQRILIIFT